MSLKRYGIYENLFVSCASSCRFGSRRWPFKMGVGAHHRVFIRSLQVSVRLPSLAAAAGFCVESGPYRARPFGVHKPWRHRSRCARGGDVQYNAGSAGL